MNDGQEIPRLALSKAEAAKALGCSLRFFEMQILPELRVVRKGRRRFIAITEIERWLTTSAGASIRERLGQ